MRMLFGNKLRLEEVITVEDLVTVTFIEVAAIGILTDELHFNLLCLIGASRILLICIGDPVFSVLVSLQLVTGDCLDHELKGSRIFDFDIGFIVYHFKGSVISFANIRTNQDGTIGKCIHFHNTVLVGIIVLILRLGFLIPAGGVIRLHGRTVSQGFHLQLTVGKNGQLTICTDFAPYIADTDTMAICSGDCVACGMCYNRCPNGNIEMVDLGYTV